MPLGQCVGHIPVRMKVMGDPGTFLRVGADADITVFDPSTVTDKATYEEPLQYFEGIQFVLVNGTLTVKDGTLVEGVFPGLAARTPIRGGR
jgi:N-acyl-D-aspartate/D-glutamate deacylase